MSYKSCFDNDLIVVSNSVGEVLIYSASSGTLISRHFLHGKDPPIFSLCLTSQLLLSGASKSLNAYNLKGLRSNSPPTQSLIATFDFNTQVNVILIVNDSHSRWALAALGDGRIVLCDLIQRTLAQSLAVHNAPITCLKPIPKSTINSSFLGIDNRDNSMNGTDDHEITASFASASLDGALAILSLTLPKGEMEVETENKENDDERAKQNERGKTNVKNDNSLESEELIHLVNTIRPFSKEKEGSKGMPPVPVRTLAISECAEWMAVGGDCDFIALWHLGMKAMVKCLPITTFRTNSLLFFNDSVVSFAAHDEEIYFWSLNGKIIDVVPLPMIASKERDNLKRTRSSSRDAMTQRLNLYDIAQAPKSENSQTKNHFINSNSLLLSGTSKKVFLFTYNPNHCTTITTSISAN